MEPLGSDPDPLEVLLHVVEQSIFGEADTAAGLRAAKAAAPYRGMSAGKIIEAIKAGRTMRELLDQFAKR